jgi:hypothetical protein
VAQYNKGVIYNDVIKKIQAKKDNGEKVALNFHIPGTGGRKDSISTTYEALQRAVELDPNTPIIYFEGVGSEGDDYVAPVMADPYTLEPVEIKRAQKIARGFTLASTSDLDDIGALHPQTALAIGVVAGAGKKTNTQRIIHTLAQLEKDGALPQAIHLTGHSRGAINTIDAANKIYQKFGSKLKIHLTLTDPVPGPGHWHDVEEKTLPPTVVSCNIFYADSEEGIFFAANDATRLVVTNPGTTLNFYAAKDMRHESILANKNVYASLCALTCAINGNEYNADNDVSEYKQKVDNRYDYGLDKTSDMTGKTWVRSDANFYATSPINKACDPILTTAINGVRERFEQTPQVTKTEAKVAFKVPALATELERKKYIYDSYREAMWQRSHVSYGEMLAFLLIVPTFGLSANLYRTNQQITLSSQLLNFGLGLCSLNIAPTVDMALDTGRKVVHNLVHRGFFRPAISQTSSEATANNNANGDSDKLSLISRS